MKCFNCPRIDRDIALLHTLATLQPQWSNKLAVRESAKQSENDGLVVSVSPVTPVEGRQGSTQINYRAQTKVNYKVSKYFPLFYAIVCRAGLAPTPTVSEMESIAQRKLASILSWRRANGQLMSHKLKANHGQCSTHGNAACRRAKGPIAKTEAIL